MERPLICLLHRTRSTATVLSCVWHTGRMRDKDFCLPEILLRSEDLPPELVRRYQVTSLTSWPCSCYTLHPCLTAWRRGVVAAQFVFSGQSSPH